MKSKLIPFSMTLAMSLTLLLVLTGFILTQAGPSLAAPFFQWQQANPNGFGKPQNAWITFLTDFEGQMVAGTQNPAEGAGVWRTRDGQNWTPFTAPWSVSNTIVLDARTFGDHLYVGSGNENGGEVWRTDGTNWEQVAFGGFDDSHNTGMSALAVYANTLLAATDNFTTGVEIWVSPTGDPGDWRQANDDGFGDGTGTQRDLTLDTYGGALYVGIGRMAGTAELWRTDNLRTWTPVFTDGLGNANNTHVSAMAAFNGAFYIGLRNLAAGGEVWRSDDGLAWTPVFTAGLGNPDNQRPYGLIVVQDHLYLVFSNLVTGAEVWRSADGTAWEQISDQGWGDRRNGFADYFDKAALVFKHSLYIGTINDAEGGEVWATAFPVSDADDPCVYEFSTLQFKCDLAHDGNRAELRIAFGEAGDVPLVGDIDGSGLDDPCVFRPSDAHFYCDTAHDGGNAEWRLHFGFGTDTPLLGDLDGNGRDDPCVFRGTQFYCDTAHDGGDAEIVIRFGISTDRPLLGDMDGDGRDDPCVHRSALIRFSCDTAHDGGTGEINLEYGFDTDIGLIGDIDGDGVDEICVFRPEEGRFFFDTGHDGVIGEVEIDFGTATDIPLAGNIE